MKNCIKVLSDVNEFIKEFKKFEMTSDVEAEVEEIEELSNITTLNGKESDIFERLYQIQDDLAEIEMLTGYLMKNIPEDRKNLFCQLMGISPVDKEDIGMSESRRLNLLEIMEIVDEALENNT